MKLICAGILFILSLNSVEAKTLNIGVLYWSGSIEGQVIMRKGLEEMTATINKDAARNSTPQIKLRTYLAGDGNEGIQNQLRQFYELINRTPDLIIIQPTDNAALSSPLKLANAKGIPVIAFDQYIVGGKLLSLITSDNYQAGYLDGEYLASLYPDQQTIKLVLVEYPNVSSTIDRVDGFFDALKKEKQKFNVLKSYQAVEPIAGARVGLEITKDFEKPGELDAVFAVNDGAGLALTKELIKAGRTEIKVATVDGDPASVELIKKEKIIVIDSAQFCAEIGRQSILKAYDHLNGENIPRIILVPTFPVTSKTIKHYPGWMGNIPKRFPKPWKPKQEWNNSFKLKK